MAKDKDKRPINLQIRKEWAIKPVTKIVPNKKIYDRKKIDKQMRESSVKFHIEIDFSPVTIGYSVCANLPQDSYIFTELVDVAAAMVERAKVAAKEAAKYGNLMENASLYSNDDVILKKEGSNLKLSLRIVIHSNSLGDKMRLKKDVEGKPGYKVIL